MFLAAEGGEKKDVRKNLLCTDDARLHRWRRHCFPLFTDTSAENGPATFVRVAKRASEGAAHADVSVLQVLQHQVLHWDWLPVHLETVALVPGDGTRQHQQLGEQEHVQLLEKDTERSEINK